MISLPIRDTQLTKRANILVSRRPETNTARETSTAQETNTARETTTALEMDTMTEITTALEMDAVTETTAAPGTTTANLPLVDSPLQFHHAPPAPVPTAVPKNDSDRKRR
jgi:hypothetical protein